MHYAGRRSTIAGETGMSKKERERRTEKGRESIELGYEVEKGGMILMENVRERKRTERRRRERQRRRRGGATERKERERARDMICLSPERRTARRMSREGLQRDRGNWSQTQYDN